MADEVTLPEELAAEFRIRERESYDELKIRQRLIITRLIEEGKKVIRIPGYQGDSHYLIVTESPLEVALLPVGEAWRAPGVMIRGLRLNDLGLMLARR